MSDITKTKDFMKIVDEVKLEYPEGSLERKIPTSFITTVAAVETGNFNFKNADTANEAKNFFGIHATGDQEFLPTSGGAKLRSFEDNKGSIRAFINLVKSDERYKDTIEAIDKGPQEMFKGMSVYAENPEYTNILDNVYRNRIEPIFQTENFLLPKRKPITEQMDSLQ
jgi:uncharacterized FlgJ-related protein